MERAKRVHENRVKMAALGLEKEASSFKHRHVPRRPSPVCSVGAVVRKSARIASEQRPEYREAVTSGSRRCSSTLFTVPSTTVPSKIERVPSNAESQSSRSSSCAASPRVTPIFRAPASDILLERWTRYEPRVPQEKNANSLEPSAVQARAIVLAALEEALSPAYAKACRVLLYHIVNAAESLGIHNYADMARWFANAPAPESGKFSAASKQLLCLFEDWEVGGGKWRSWEHEHKRRLSHNLCILEKLRTVLGQPEVLSRVRDL